MKKVLLVDDDQLVLRLYSKKLEQAGIEVQTATDGLLAMKAMSATPPVPLKASADLALTWEVWDGDTWKALVVAGETPAGAAKLRSGAMIRSGTWIEGSAVVPRAR